MKQNIITLLLILWINLIKTDDPMLTLNIHPPVEVKEEVEEQIKELAKLEEEEIKSQEEDFMIEKKKLVEAQRVRIKTIVHGAFEAVNSLIPNPIKSSIRKELKAMLGQKEGVGQRFEEIEDNLNFKRNLLLNTYLNNNNKNNNNNNNNYYYNQQQNSQSQII